MRFGGLVITAVLAVAVQACQVVKSGSAATKHLPPVPTIPVMAKPDFETDIKPILQNRCQPCHFQGGKVYDKLPFDRPDTIKKLGTRLFTRIKDEKEQQLIRDFLQ